MNNIKNNLKFVSAGVILGAMFFAAMPGIAQKVTLKPIKPTGNTAVTDEQQAILAVRSVKPSVVDIVGVSPGIKVVIGGDKNAPEQQDSVTSVEGTGFIIDKSGLIVSNNHVVQNSSLVYTVILADGTRYPAKVVGLDKFDDIALLKIEAQNMPAIKFGDSSALETGQSVFAIGNSLGRYQNTVTRGVVSGLGRTLDVASYEDNLPRMQQLIQTDAAINPGNSGGPLINMAGEVVGMNTVIDQGGSSIGFAIPSSMIKDVVQQLQTFGVASRPYLGVSFMTINTFFSLGPTRPTQGAYINEVKDSSPAQAAGFKKGDIITAVNGTKLSETLELDKLISTFAAGTQILVTYDRDGKSFDATVILAGYK